MFVLLVLSLVAMAVVVTVSFVLYTRLPHSTLRHAEVHGRYAGLGDSTRRR